MKYMGSKNRHAKDILEIVLKNRKEGQWYVEPFCGGCNVIDKVTGNRMANDSHYYLIEMWKALINDKWIPPKSISEQDYKKVAESFRGNSLSQQIPPYLMGYIGFNSYGGKWLGGYRRDKIGKRDYGIEHWNNIFKQKAFMDGVIFSNMSYDKLILPEKSLIYCDPPYAGSTSYKDKFDHKSFWGWVRKMARDGHNVFVSEYAAPDDFLCVWEKTVNNTLVKNTGSKQGVEKLFVYTCNVKDVLAAV